MFVLIGISTGMPVSQGVIGFSRYWLAVFAEASPDGSLKRPLCDTVMRSFDPSIDISRETLTSALLFPERAIRLSEIF